jgi:hypothetical protein
VALGQGQYEVVAVEDLHGVWRLSSMALISTCGGSEQEQLS